MTVCLPCVSIAGPLLLDFNSFANGTPSQNGEILSGFEFADPGFGFITLSTNDPNNHPLQIFDTSNPTFDRDLGTANEDFGGPGRGDGGQAGQLGANTEALGNVLIISGTNDTSEANDYARGGVISIDIEQGADISYVDILDIDRGDRTIITALDADGNVLRETLTPDFGDNAVARVGLQLEDVFTLQVEFEAGGAVSGICFDDGDFLSNISNCDSLSGPSADAGEGYTFDVSNLSVNLDGSNSNDVDGTIIDYSWQTSSGEIQSINLSQSNWFNLNSSATLNLVDSGLKKTTDTTEVSLVVTDETSLQDSETALLSYTNALPSLGSISYQENDDLSVSLNFNLDDPDLAVNSLISGFEMFSSYDVLFDNSIIYSSAINSTDLIWTDTWTKSQVDTWFGDGGLYTVGLRVNDQASSSSDWEVFALELSPRSADESIPSPSILFLFVLGVGSVFFRHTINVPLSQKHY